MFKESERKMLKLHLIHIRNIRLAAAITFSNDRQENARIFGRILDHQS